MKASDLPLPQVFFQPLQALGAGLLLLIFFLSLQTSISAEIITANGHFIGPSRNCTVSCMLRAPDNPQIYYCVPTANNRNFPDRPAHQFGFYKSVDGGNTWQTVANPWPTTATVTSLRFIDGRLFAFLYQPMEFWVSDDKGATWQLSWKPADPIQYQNLKAICCESSPLDPKTALVGFQAFDYSDDISGFPDFARTQDGGQTWTTGTLKNPRFHSLWCCYFDPSTSGRVIAGGGGILYESSDNGTTWHDTVTSLPHALQLTELASSPKYPGIVYASGIDSIYPFISLSTDYGRTWTTQASFSQFFSDGGLNLFLDDQASSTIYASANAESTNFLPTELSGLFLSDDSGQHLKNISDGLAKGDFILSFYQDETGSPLIIGYVSGINRYNSVTRRFDHFDGKGLPKIDSTVMSALLRPADNGLFDAIAMNDSLHFDSPWSLNSGDSSLSILGHNDQHKPSWTSFFDLPLTGWGTDGLDSIPDGTVGNQFPILYARQVLAFDSTSVTLTPTSNYGNFLKPDPFDQNRFLLGGSKLDTLDRSGNLLSEQVINPNPSEDFQLRDCAWNGQGWIYAAEDGGIVRTTTTGYERMNDGLPVNYGIATLYQDRRGGKIAISSRPAMAFHTNGHLPQWIATTLPYDIDDCLTAFLDPLTYQMNWITREKRISVANNGLRITQQPILPGENFQPFLATTAFDILYMLSNNLLVVEDLNSDAWTSRSISNVTSLFASQTIPGLIYWIDQAGNIHRSTDDGLHDTVTGAVPGPYSSWFRFGRCDAHSSTSLIAYYDSTLYRSDNAGSDWVPILTSRDLANVVQDTSLPDKLYGLSYKGIFWKSLDRGDHWTSSTIQPVPMPVAIGKDMIIDPDDSNHLTVALPDHGLWESHDQGDIWTPITQPFLNSISMTDIAISGSDFHRWYAIGPDGVFLKSDSNQEWRQILPGSFTTIAVNPENPLDIVVGGEYRQGAQISNDGGGSWQSVETGIPDLTVNEVRIRVLNGTCHLVMSTDHGIWTTLPILSTSAARDWTLYR